MKTNVIRSTFLAAALLGSTSSQAQAGEDNFAAATEISGGQYTSPNISLLNYTSENGEPPLVWEDGAAGKSAWWKWTAPEDGFCTVDTLKEPETMAIYDPIIGVYTGATVNALTRVVFSDDHWTNINGGTYRGGSCTFYATKNTTYHITVDGLDASSVTAAQHRVRLHLGLLPKRASKNVGVWRDYTDPTLFGNLTFTKTSAFSFSAKFTHGTKSYPFSGVLSPEGFFSTAFPRTSPVGSPPLTPIGLIIDAKVGGFFHVSTGGADWDSQKLYEVIQFPVGTVSQVAGNFSGSFMLNGLNGQGMVFATVKPNGTTSGTTTLPDGVKVTFSGPLAFESSTESVLPLCTTLHGGKGHCLQKLKFADLGQHDHLLSQGSIYYIRPPAAKSAFYPNGINSYGSLFGGTWTKPALNQRALGFLDGAMGDGTLQIPSVLGEINAVMENLNFSTANKFIFKTPAMRKPVLTLNMLTGQVTGSIYEPAGKKRTLTGALYKYNNQLYLRGQVSGTTQNVSFEVKP